MISKTQPFLDALKSQLRGLTQFQQVAFGAITCSRHFPDYVTFSAEQHWGNPDVLQRAIDLAWATVADPANPATRDTSALLAECVDATPDSDDFAGKLPDYAQDAAIMVCYLVQFLEKRDVESLQELASKSRDLVDAKVQITNRLKPNDPELEERIANDPLMRAELASLSATLEAVRARSVPYQLLELRSFQF